MTQSHRIRHDQNARRMFFFITLLPVLLIIIVTIALFIRSWPILKVYSFSGLIQGEIWKPSKGLFGLKPFISGTIWVTGVSLILSVPACLLVSIYLSEYAHRSTRGIIKPVLDLLAAIPPVIYGVWGLLTVVPFIDRVIAPFSEWYLNTIPIFSVHQPTGFGILAGGIVLAVMISPLIISVVHEILTTFPADLRNASLAVGATRWQTIVHVVLPKVCPGILAAIVLGTSRALGETIAVLMVVGNVPSIPRSIFDTAYPLPALIANNYGDMMSIPLYDAALLTAALILLMVILIFNILSTLVIQRIMRKKWI